MYDPNLISPPNYLFAKGRGNSAVSAIVYAIQNISALKRFDCHLFLSPLLFENNAHGSSLMARRLGALVKYRFITRRILSF